MPTQTSLSAVADSNGDGSQEPEAKPDPGHEADVSENEASRELKSQLSKSQGEFRQSWITQAKKDEFAQLFSEVEPNQ